MGRDRQGPPRCQVQSPQFFEDVPEEQLWWRCPAEQLRIRQFRPSCDSQFNCHRPSLQELSSLKESRKESQDREILGHLLLRMRDRQGPPRCQVQSPQFFEDVPEEQLWWCCPAEQLRIRRFRPSCDSQFNCHHPSLQELSSLKESRKESQDREILGHLLLRMRDRPGPPP